MLDRLTHLLPEKLLPEKLKGDLGLIVRILNEQARAHWRRLIVIAAFMGVAAAATASFAYLFSHVINDVYYRRSFSDIVALAIVIILLFTAKGLATYGQAVMLARVANRITAENQRRMFDKLVQEGMEYLADRRSSEFMTILMQGTTAVSGVLRVVVLALGRDLLTLIGLVVVMTVQKPFLSLIGIVIMPPAVIGVRKLIKRVRNLATMQFSHGMNILQLMQETVQGFRVVKAFNLEDEMRRRIGQDISHIEWTANKIARVSSRRSPIMETLGGFAIAIVMIYGGFLVLETGAPPGAFVSFMGAFLLAYEPAKRIAGVNIDLSNSMVGVRALYDMLDTPATEADDNDKPALAVAGGRVQFIDVDFSYQPGQPVLRRMSFVAEPDQVTALVGPSGGGKSTIFSLLLDFYRLQGGAVVIDGQQIGDVARKSVRANIAYVGQEPFLFRGSVRDNIMCGLPGAADAEVVEAAKAANAHDFIMSFPLGYDAEVGEIGSRLSLGQRQRVAIARALIKNAPIVLLDEPTASLDSESEHKVKEALRRLCAGKTTLVIAHHLNTIVDADCIHVVENGRIVESGRHDELLREGGRYATFSRLQFPGNQERQADPEQGRSLDPALT